MTDKIAEIRKRYAFAEENKSAIRPAGFSWTIPGWQAHNDRSYLLAEVDRLTRERDEARAEVEWLRAENKRLFTRRCEVERLRADRVHRNDLRAEAWEEGWFARDCQKSDWNENPYRGGEGNERHN